MHIVHCLAKQVVKFKVTTYLMIRFHLETGAEAFHLHTETCFHLVPRSRKYGATFPFSHSIHCVVLN